jgi:hypothetical protein
MPYKWLQVKGDPMVRAFLFAQQRAESYFDPHLDRVHEIVQTLLLHKGVFNIRIHYSSSQLTCWFCDDVYRNRVYVREEVLDPGFLEQFRGQSVAHLHPVVDADEITRVLAELKRLRLTDEQIYLRIGSLNQINGRVGMTFSCDGSHYIDHRTFFEKLETFGKTAEEGLAACDLDERPPG